MNKCVSFHLITDYRVTCDGHRAHHEHFLPQYTNNFNKSSSCPVGCYVSAVSGENQKTQLVCPYFGSLI